MDNPLPARPLVSVVIPTRNEEGTIGSVLDDLAAALARVPDCDFEVIVVDDSEDRTSDIAASKGARVIRGGSPPGKGRALRQGFEAARGELIGMMDGDCSHRPEDFPALLAAVRGGAGLAIANRVAGGSDEFTTVRALGNTLLTFLYRALHGHPIADALNGYKVFRREVFSSFRYTSTELEIEIEILANARRLGYRIAEVPSHERERRAGHPKSRAVRHGTMLLWRIVTEWLCNVLGGRPVPPPPPAGGNRRTPPAFWLILGLGALLRIPGLFSTVNPDEMHLIQQSLPGPAYALMEQWRADVHPPLNFITFSLWMKAGLADWWLRLPSLAFSVLTLWLLWRFVLEAVGERMALLSTAVLAVAPCSVFYSTWMKHYPLVTLLGVAILLSCYRGLRGARRWAWAYVPLAVFGIYWHYSVILVLLAANVLVLLAWLRRECAIPVRRWIGAQAVVLLCFLPWLPVFWEQTASDRGILMGSPLVDANRMIKVPYFFYALSLAESVQPWELVPVVAGTVLFAGAFLAGLRKSWSAGLGGIAVLAFLLVPLVVASFKRVAVPKHIAFVMPYYCVVLAFFLSALKSRRAAAILWTCLLSLWSYSNFNILTARNFHDASMRIPWRAIASQMRNSISEGDLVVFYPAQDARYLRHYFPDVVRQEALLTAGSDADVDDQLRKLPPFRRAWAVLLAGDRESSERQRDLIAGHLERTNRLVESADYVREEHLRWTLPGVFLREGARPYTFVQLRVYESP